MIHWLQGMVDPGKPLPSVPKAPIDPKINFIGFSETLFHRKQRETPSITEVLLPV